MIYKEKLCCFAVQLIGAIQRSSLNLGSRRHRLASGKKEMLRLEKEIEAIVERIMSATNDAVIARYERKVENLEFQKQTWAEKLSMQAEPQGAFEEKLELACKFLSSPWKIWETGNVQAKRLVLKLAFSTPIRYRRNEGARTPDLSLPFKALGGNSNMKFCCGAGGGVAKKDQHLELKQGIFYVKLQCPQ